MGDDVCTELKRTAVDRGGEGVINDERNAVGMSHRSELFDVEHFKSGVGKGFGKNRLGVGLECGVQLLLACVRADKGEVNAELSHGDIEKIVCSSVNCGRADYMVACSGNVEDRIERSRLTG